MTQDNLREDLAVDEAKQDALVEQLAKLQACVFRKRKVLEGAEGQARKKLQCLVAEMEVDGEDLSVMVIDTSVLQAELFSPASAGTAAGGAGSSQGS